MDINGIMENFLGLITPEMYLVVAAVYGLCYALKRARFFDDRFIPLAALGFGVVFEVLIAAVFSRQIIMDAILRGIVCGMAAVFVANIVKQAQKGGGESDAGK